MKGQDPIIGGPKTIAAPPDGKTDTLCPDEGTLALTDGNSTKFGVTGFAKEVDTSATPYKQDFFVTSRGGEYFFVPSISTLEAWGARASQT